MGGDLGGDCPPNLRWGTNHAPPPFSSLMTGKTMPNKIPEPEDLTSIRTIIRTVRISFSGGSIYSHKIIIMYGGKDKKCKP